MDYMSCSTYPVICDIFNGCKHVTVIPAQDTLHSFNMVKTGALGRGIS